MNIRVLSSPSEGWATVLKLNKLKFNKISKISIKWKLFIYMTLFVAATLVLLWLFQVVFLQNFYKSIKISDIKSAAVKISENIDSSSFDTTLTAIAHKSDVSVIVADEKGNILNSEEIMPNSSIRYLSNEEFLYYYNNAKKSGGTYLKRFDLDKSENQDIHPSNDMPSDKTGGTDFANPVPRQARHKAMMESIIYTKIVTKKDKTKCVIVLNAYITPVDATVQTIRTQLLYVTLIMLIFALLLALFISKKISKPIIKINASAKELAKGRYDVKFDANGYKEIHELGNTLNYAAGELAKTENLQRELIANISHDLRTPLTMITGYSEVMRDLPGENTPENVQIIIDEAKRLTSLVNDVLDISKLQSGTQQLKMTDFNLTESIKDILKRYQKLIEQDGYSIKFFYDDDAYIYADELRISQVVYNLVNNALTYTGKDKMVIVRQSASDENVKIEIIDTGEGISADKLPYIWDRYYKVGKEHRRAAVGTGLGLSIVKAILEQHGAKYGVQSTVGQGSIFWFELPLKKT